MYDVLDPNIYGARMSTENIIPITAWHWHGTVAIPLIESRGYCVDNVIIDTLAKDRK
jgi:hypothetical protein